MHMLFLARLVIACRAKEWVLLAFTVQTYQATLFLVDTLRIAKCPGTDTFVGDRLGLGLADLVLGGVLAF